MQEENFMKKTEKWVALSLTVVMILSLYGDEDTHFPSEENMDTFDVLVVDMQDVGLRYYTYYNRL